MRDNINTVGFSSAAFEITRRCNLACEHCIRGEAQNMDMSPKVIDRFYDGISELQEIIFTGGEPLLNIEGMDYVISQSIRRNFPLYSLIFTTNGTIFNSDVRYYLERWAFYIKSCHVRRGTDYKGRVKICVSCDGWHDRQLALLGKKERSNDLYSRFYEYFHYLDDVYDVIIADDGNEPINLGRAKKLLTGKSVDIDENNITHKLCLIGKYQDACFTVKNGFEKEIYPEKADALVNCMVWLLCDGRLVARGNMPYDYAYNDIICNVSTSHDIFTDVIAYNSRIPQNRLCSSDAFWVYCGKIANSATNPVAK